MMITEDDLQGVSRSPISIQKFFDVDWKVFYLPNGDRNHYCHPSYQNFFESPSLNSYWKNTGGRGSFADLSILQSAIREWYQKGGRDVLGVRAIFLFGSSVRLPPIKKRISGFLCWKKEIEELGNINPNDVDVLILTSDLDGSVSKLPSKSREFQLGGGSSSWSHIVRIMGFDINALSVSEFRALLENFEHPCQVANNIRREGVLIAGGISGLDLQTQCSLIWNERRLTCSVNHPTIERKETRLRRSRSPKSFIKKERRRRVE